MASAATSSQTANPWLSAAPQPLDLDADEVAALTGPPVPQLGLVPAPQPAALPRRVLATPATWWWVGAHGGAGESTLATAVAGTAASEHTWPQPCPDVGGTHPVLLVARTHASGLLAAQRALTEWAAGGAGAVELLGLVLLADAPGRAPAPLRDLARLVAGGAPRTWSLPWVEAWRLGGAQTDLRASASTPTPAALRRLQSQVTRLLGS